MAVVGTAFRSILSAMKQAIIDANILTDGDVYVAIRMNPPQQDQRKALIIVPLYQTTLRETSEGHGRCATFKKARVNVYYRHESALDQSYQDDIWALADGGYYDMIDRLEDLFDLWHPLIDPATSMLTQPAQLVMGNEPRKNYKDHIFGEGMIELELEFKALRTV